MNLKERLSIQRLWRESLPVLMGWYIYRPACREDNPGIWESAVPCSLKPPRLSEVVAIDIEDPFTSAGLVESSISACVKPEDANAVRANLRACLADDRKPLIDAGEKVNDMRDRVIVEVHRQYIEARNV